MFNDDCKLWRRQPADVKTWTRFKEFFATAHQEWRELQTTTSGAVFQSGNHAYPSANHAYENETVEAIANVATATASDHASVTALTATNRTLTTTCTATQSQLLIALQDLSKLHVTVADLRKKKTQHCRYQVLWQLLEPLLMDMRHSLRPIQSKFSHSCGRPPEGCYPQRKKLVTTRTATRLPDIRRERLILRILLF